MSSCIYPGSFDPIHNGHIDVIENLTLIFDKVYVAPLINKNKKGRFCVSDRILFIEKALVDLENYDKIEIVTFDGLLADFVVENKVNTIVKGLRNTMDFEMEKEMAHSIKLLDNNVQTLFFPATPKYSSISSTIVYDLIKNNGNLKSFLPKDIVEMVKQKTEGLYE